MCTIAMKTVLHRDPTLCQTFLLLAAFAVSPQAAGQCPFGWRPGEGKPGVDGDAAAMSATTWDPDGAGPQPELLIVGGTFDSAGDVLASCIAAWDGEEWRALGSGIGGSACGPANHLSAVDL